MSVGNRASSPIGDNYSCEVNVDGVNPDSVREIDEENISSIGDLHRSFSRTKKNSESQGSQFSFIIEDEGTVITSLEDLMLEEENLDEKQGNDGDLLKAPDGGYAWVICAGVFLNQMIFGGLGRCQGLFFLQFQSTFDTSAQLAAWPGSLMSTLHLFMGPLCGAVVSRYSVRTASFIGSTFIFLGMLLSAFAPNIYFLFLSYTILEGIGRGLLAGILLLNLYFDKHRSVATGLGMSGVGVGSLWVVPLTQFLFDEYGFTGAFMIIAALSLNGYVVSMIYRPLSMHLRFFKSKYQKSTGEPRNTEESMSLRADSNGNIEKHQINENHQVNEKHQDSDIPKEIDSELDKLSAHSDKVFIDSNGENPDGKTISVEEGWIKEETKSISDTDSKSLNLPVTTQPSSNIVVSLPDGIEPLLRNSVTENNVQTEHYEDNCCKSCLKIIFPVEFKQKGKTKKKKAFHWNLFKHVPFMIFCISNFLFILAFKTAFTFLPAIAMSKGLSKQEAALVLTISGALDTFGRMAFGFVMDLKPLQPFRPYAFNILPFIIAAASLMMPSLTEFTSFSLVCAVYGFMTGAFIAQKMVIIVDVLGREMMPSALGIQKVFQGFGTLVGPPLAGALKDVLGNYDSSFYLGGASMIGSGVFMFLSTILLTAKNKKAKS